jgi:hypothetical protein
MKLTPWFSGDQKPVRPGVYERNYKNAWDGEFLMGQPSYFDGIYWYAGAWDSEQAVEAWENYVVSDYQSLPWRGILRNGK